MIYSALSRVLEQAVGAPPQGEPPKDSIEGAVLGLLHAVIDGMVSAIPRTMQLSSSVNRTTRPVQIGVQGHNSQGLVSRLVIQVDLDQTLQGIRADVRLQLLNQQGQVVAAPGQTFAARRNESVRGIVKQFSEWLGQAEALQMAPVGMAGQRVL